MSILSFDSVVIGPEIGGSYNEVHVKVGIIVLFKLNWCDLIAIYLVWFRQLCQ